MFDVYQQPWTILVVAVIFVVGIWIFHTVAIDRRRWWHWLLVILVSASGFGIDWYFKTDTEKIHLTMKKAAKAVSAEDVDLLSEVIADDYRDSLHRNKNALLNNFGSRFSVNLFKKVITQFVQLEIDSTGKMANSTLIVRVIFDEESFMAKSYKSFAEAKVVISFSKEGEVWKISTVDLLTVDRQPMGWKDVTGMQW